MNIIEVKEHETLTPEQLDLSGIDLKHLPAAEMANPRNCLGLSVSGWPGQKVSAGYYVGAAWLSEGRSSIMVHPKIGDVDFMRMFVTALESREEDLQDKLTGIYGIDFRAAPIPLSGLPVDITPMLMLHFIKLLSPIVAKGLKSNYTYVEENLHGKLKGKLLIGKHIKNNMMRGRVTDNYCRHQHFEENCIENRILGSAFDIAAAYLSRYCTGYYHDLRREISNAALVFKSIDRNVPPAEISRYRVNPIFRDYARAIGVARMVLRRSGCDIRNLDNAVNVSTPPFWIDMPLLFELYALAMLRRRYGRLISYHITSRGNEIDFGKADEHLIIDAKYKHSWQDHIDHNNVRQLAGYARNVSLRRKLTGYSDTETIFPCMIIHPDQNGVESMTSAPDALLSFSGVSTVDSYVNFSKLGIRLPETGCGAGK